MNSANSAWIRILTDLYEAIEETDEIAPRGQSTTEILFNRQIFDMNRPICYHQKRRLNYAFSAAEAYFITHGDNRVENLAKYNKNITQFSDDGLIFNGSYGPPFNEQLMFAIDTLRKDIHSRQSVISIWKPNPVESTDIRCTLTLQFLVRDNEINTKVTMRSSDCWLGIPYDFFNFTLMTIRVLTLLNKDRNTPVELGHMEWSAGSSHMYLHNKDSVYNVLEEVPNKTPASVPKEALTNWRFVTDSLIACMDKDKSSIETQGLWKIRP